MASYHLSVKTIKRSAGRTATAAGAYRAGERIECQREGRVHDYTRKQGIEETFIVAPENAPAWAQDRAANGSWPYHPRSASRTGRRSRASSPRSSSAATVLPSMWRSMRRIVRAISGTIMRTF